MKAKIYILTVLLTFAIRVAAQHPVKTAVACFAVSPNITTQVTEDTITAKTFYSILCTPRIETQPTSATITYSMPSFYNLSSSSHAVDFKQVGNIIYYADEDRLYAFTIGTAAPIWVYTPLSGYNIISFDISGSFVYVTTEYLQSLPPNLPYIDKLNLSTGAILAFNNLDVYTSVNGDYLAGSIKSTKIISNKLVIGGKFICYNNNVIVDSNIITLDLSTQLITPLNLKINDTVKDIKLFRGNIHLAGSFTKVGIFNRLHYAYFNPVYSLLSSAIGFNGDVDQIEFYDKYLFALGRFTQMNTTVVSSITTHTMCAVNTTNNKVRDFNLQSLGGNNSNLYVFKIIQNKLHVANKKTGLTYHRYFLPPRLSATAISAASPTLVCVPKNNLTFSITPALYHNGYQWAYTGTGATLTFTNTNASLNLSNIATSGQLKVWATSAFGGNSDTLSIAITALPQPNAVASLIDNTITCAKPKVPILANSTTPNTAFAWVGPGGYNSSNQNDSSSYNAPGKYIVTVTNTLTTCQKKDSLFIFIDTLRPIVITPTLPVDLYCNPDSSLLIGNTSSPSPLLWWHKANSSVILPNPCYIKNIGNYYLVVKNTINACKDSTVFTIGDKRILPNVKILSHTYISPISPLDTITCTKTAISVVAASDTLNTLFSWKSIPGNASFSNPLNLTAQGNYKLLVNRTDNGCADSSLIVYIAQNITTPNIAITTPNASINCSSATTTLNANTSFTSTTLNWTGPSGFTSPNPATVSAQGKYYINAIRADNGCTKKDSVTVLYSPTLIVKTNNDTTVCKNATINLQANATGTVSGITYSWSNLNTGQAITVNPSVTSQYIVTASSTSGCSGKDTVLVTIPTDIQDSIATTKNCNGTAVGSISIYANGGIAPYLYSFNGGAFTTQTTYTNLPYATYPITIKDALGCTKSTSGTISQNSSLPVPVFIASTQNTKGDTVVLIDLTVPKADSVQWLIPPSASIVGGDMFNPLVLFADTGNFVITLTAYYANCNISTTKTIHVGPIDTSYAAATNNNGIKSITLYPNPNTGIFTADIEFYKTQNASVQIWNGLGIKQYQQNFLNTSFISLPVDVSSLINGTYIFKVIGEYNTKHLNFVISK